MMVSEMTLADPPASGPVPDGMADVRLNDLRRWEALLPIGLGAVFFGGEFGRPSALRSFSTRRMRDCEHYGFFGCFVVIAEE